MLSRIFFHCFLLQPVQPIKRDTMRCDDVVLRKDNIQFGRNSLFSRRIKSHPMNNQVDVVISFEKLGSFLLLTHRLDDDTLEFEHVTEFTFTITTISYDIEPDQFVRIRQDFMQLFKRGIYTKLAVLPDYCL